MQLQEAIVLFLGDYGPSTRQAYAGPLIRMRDWLGPTRLVGEITPAVLVEYFQNRVANRGLSPATVQKHAKTIKTFFNWCARLELIQRSPAFAIRARRPPRAISREKAMRDDELAAILDVLRHKYIPRDYALVLFLADTGCRRSGAANLRWQDMDLTALTAMVTEKGGNPRKVAFSEDSAKAISKWLFFRSVNYRIRDTYVFSLNGRPMNPENVSLIIRRACRRAGVRVLSAHSLRHRKGHQFADARIAPSIAATALGHSDPLITVTYYYPSDWETAEAALRELMRIEPAEALRLEEGHNPRN